MGQRGWRRYTRAREYRLRWFLLLALLCAACNGTNAPTTTPQPPTVNLPLATTAPPTTSTLSEGVHATGADGWQAAGITGKGVRVGIIDAGFLNYTQMLGGAKATVRSFREDGEIADTPATADTMHGTACAEIVHEMAPDAELFLAATDTTGSFLAAMQWLVNDAHVAIITTSLGFYGDYPTDGSSVLAQAVDKAKAAGVFVVKSAGNFADKHYGATFADTDGDGFHDFPGGKTKNGMTVKMTGDPFEIFLNWDDWQQPHVNYDLYLYNSAGQEAARSDTDQARTGKRPVEHLMGTLPTGTYTLKIKKVNPRDPDLPMNLIIRGGVAEQTMPEGSLTVPGDARGAVAVAAINVQTEGVETFSSHGPTLDGRAKPDLGAPDRVMSGAYASVGVANFLGTSAAAPHVAGAAALYKQAVPDATPDAILAFLAQHADAPQGKERGTNITGSGRLDLGAPPGASNQVAQPAPPPAPDVSRPGPRFTDDFASPTSGLPPQGYVGGGYRVAADASMLTVLAYPTPLPIGDAVYAMQARKTGGADDTMMGLVVRRVDERNALYFIIANDGAFNVLAKMNSSTRSLTGGWQSSAAIISGETNALRVEATGSVYAFFVNGQLMTRVTVPESGAPGAFGLLAEGGRQASGEITFTNYAVTAP
ncbi:MAG: S8 family serine peptidase [Chloroflexota bacterium]|nr:S8 family serine peptidase [Chloroflexota bacterium]